MNPPTKFAAVVAALNFLAFAGGASAEPLSAQDRKPSLGNCGMESCSWSKVQARTLKPSPEGVLHVLTLLGGFTRGTDENPAHIKWNARPHQVTVLCSLTHPFTRIGGQTDELALNAAGSDVPNVLMSSYVLYAAECHPSARNLDPDQLARRFGYRARMPAG